MYVNKHWLKPLRGKAKSGRHLLLWTEADETKPVLKRISNCAWDAVLCGKALKAWCLGSWDSAADLEAILDGATKGKGALTIWIARGWEDLVLTGLAELLDRKACTWRYALLDGQRVLIRGLWRGKQIVISSLANWTGHRWDLWDEVATDDRCSAAYNVFKHADGCDNAVLTDREEQYLRTWCAIVQMVTILDLPSLAPTVATGAIQLWKQLLGPRIRVKIQWANQNSKRKDGVSTQIVIPSPFRPERSACAERHSAYGLTTRQLRRGFVDEMVHVVDLRSAYLLSLCTTPLPAQFALTLCKPSIEELAVKMAGKTGHALCRIKTSETSYPVRYDGRVRTAQGHFWTWLAGAELVYAMSTGECQEVHTAYLWDSIAIDPDSASIAMSMSGILRASRCPALQAVWRGMYSALVGQFAGRRKTWEDCPAQNGIAQWAQWDSACLETGEITRYRSIAGHVQRLVDYDDTSQSVPLFYGCITAHIRVMMQQLAHIAGLENVVCLNTDALWMTRPGWQRLQAEMSKLGLAPDNLQAKATYDRAWMNGRSITVVERNGRKSIKAPGVGEYAALDETCRAYGLRAEHWSQCESIQAVHGCQRRKVSFAGQRIIDQYSHAPVMLPLGEPIDDPLLRTELLEPVRQKRTVLDE